MSKIFHIRFDFPKFISPRFVFPKNWTPKLSALSSRSNSMGFSSKSIKSTIANNNVSIPGTLDISATLGSKTIQVTKIGDKAFFINNILARQSVILLPESFYLWKVSKFEDITIDSLSLFTLITPTIEVLFIGCGEKMPRLLPKEIHSHFKSLGIVIEATNSVNAITTFNVLNSEGRNVAAAVLTLHPTLSSSEELPEFI
eukprot:gene5351-7423_t